MWSLQRVYQTYLNKLQASQVALVVKKKKKKNPPAKAGDVRDVILISGLGKFP